MSPLFFHFIKDITTSSQFVLEIKLHGMTKDITKVGVEGLKQILPSSKPLYFVRHLQQRDKKKIDKLLSKTPFKAAEKNKVKSEILKDLCRVT